MGYTHYWEHKGIDSEQWNNDFLPLVKEIVRTSEVPVCGARGKGSPIMSEDLISLNGSAEFDEDYESFVLGNHKRQLSFDFCKTGRKPYDEVVVAILLAGKETLTGFSWQSDGNEESGDFREGYGLFLKAKEKMGANR